MCILELFTIVGYGLFLQGLFKKKKDDEFLFVPSLLA